MLAVRFVNDQHGRDDAQLDADESTRDHHLREDTQGRQEAAGGPNEWGKVARVRGRDARD